jgi:hypothetical protein
MPQLFSGPSVFEFIERKKREAVDRAESAPDQCLSDATFVERLSEQFRIDVAVLRPQDRHGKRRTVPRQVSDFGWQRSINVDVIDVSIPYSGWPKSFELRPSHSVVIHDECRIENNVLMVNFLDDESTEHKLNSFISDVSKNLDALRNDISNFSNQIRQVVMPVLEQRKSLLQARAERDRGRSFPIE